MSEHVQLQPPDYHRCLDTVFSSPAACRELLRRLMEMTEDDVRSRWSPWKGQEPPPYGERVGDQISAEVRRAMVQAEYDSCRELLDFQERELAAVVGVPVLQMSYVELIWSVRGTIRDLRHRIAELEAGTTEEG
ncbi:hypothetical protein AB0H58_05310 [Nocardia neocaledoniensis]|uniref:hypothetical protein n=1 Tax=Nocardia neocaledoniensis TaxID=236511 RepID=UPI0034066C38